MLDLTLVEEESGSVILLYCHWDPTMQDDCRRTGQESPPQHRETEEWLRELVLGPAALSTEVTQTSPWFLPALWPFPTTGCSLQLDGQLCTHQLAVSAAAQGRTTATTPSCDTHQILPTALSHWGVTSHSRRSWRVLWYIRQSEGTLRVQQICNQLNNHSFGLQEPRAGHVWSVLPLPQWSCPDKLLLLSPWNSNHITSLPALYALTAEHVARSKPYSAQGAQHPSTWRMLPSSKDITVIIFAIAYCSVHSGLCGPHPRLV